MAIDYRLRVSRTDELFASSMIIESACAEARKAVGLEVVERRPKTGRPSKRDG